MTMKPKIQMMIDKFHRRMDKDEKARAEVEPFVKKINIDLGAETYSMTLDHARIEGFSEGLLVDPDITIQTTPEYMDALIEGELRPMKAYVTKKVVIKGKIQDLMHLKKFL